MSSQQGNNSAGRGVASNHRQSQNQNGGQGGRDGNTSSKFRGTATNGIFKDIYICSGDTRPAQFSRMKKLFVPYA